MRWRRILVHHSAGADGVARDFDRILREHTLPPPDGRGWRTIGYHAVIERVGETFMEIPGRPEWMVGSHCPGQNSIALGVCLVGNFETAPPPQPQVRMLVKKLSAWCRQYRIPIGEIHGHRDYRATLCPGEYLYQLISSGELHLRVAEDLNL